jgi:hypothetical protein
MRNFSNNPTQPPLRLSAADTANALRIQGIYLATIHHHYRREQTPA